MTINTTTVFLFQDGRVLLGLKKRGFGVGKWNGFGGKLLPGEDFLTCAKRECLEECCVTALDLVDVGTLIFHQPNGDVIVNHAFYTDVFEGQPAETEEMRPAWFTREELPLDHMWPDDQYWMPYLWSRAPFEAEFFFDHAFQITSFQLRARVEN